MVKKNKKTKSSNGRGRPSARAITEKMVRMPWPEWQAKKRQEWRAVVSALSQFTIGCAYTPVGQDFWILQTAAARITDAMAEDWVSW